MQRLKHLWHRLNSVVIFIERWSLIILFVGMIICGVLQIVARFILEIPISWSEELLTYSFVWTTFLGASLAIETLSHFNVDCLVVRLPPKVATPVLYFVWICMAVFTVFLTYKSAVLAQLNMAQTMDVLPLSMFWAYLAMPVSSTFMFVHVVERLFVRDFLPSLTPVSCTE
ncbi:TRAP transporter small permease [Vibrio sp. PP-XX7]